MTTASIYENDVVILHDVNAFQLGKTPKHEAVFGFSHPSLRGPKPDVLEKVFAICNGEPPEGLARITDEYYLQGLRSLSVGDVVIVMDTAFRCESVGWSRLDGFNSHQKEGP